MAIADILVSPDTVSSQDRSFFYGDGCFTTIYCHKQSAMLLNSHINRLKATCDVLGIDIDNFNSVYDVIVKVAAEQVSDCVIKVLISRGSGGRGYQLPKEARPQVLVSCHSMPKTQDSQALGLAKTRLAVQPILAGYKHNNRLEQILARKELLGSNPRLDDLLMVSTDDLLKETSSANIFYFIENAWFTPKIDTSGVSGVMRNYILSKAEHLDITITETTSHFSILNRIEAMFVTNAVKLAVPVKSIEYEGKVISLDVERTMLLCSKIRKTLLG